MLSRTHRFHGLNALNFAHKQGQVVRGPAMSLKYVLNQRRQSYRMAVVVSKKVSKSAVVRNRIRRRVYEQVRGMLPAAAPYDLVFTVYSDDLAAMQGKDINRIITQLLQTAGLDTRDRGLVDNSPGPQKTI